MDRDAHDMPETPDPRPPGGHPIGLVPLEARLVASSDGVEPGGWVTLKIRPMHVAQTQEVWCSELPSPARTILLEGSFEADSAAGMGEAMGLLGELAARSRVRLGSSTTGSVAVATAIGEALVLEDAEFERLVQMLSWRTLVAARLEGPVEASDLEAMRRACAAGLPAIAGDLRAVASLRVEPDGGIEFAARTIRPIARLIAEDLACYVAAVLRREIDDISRPAVAQITRLLEVSGSIRIRPEETDVFAQSVDVGICTSEHDGPAANSLIYDLPSDSWHDE